MAVGHRDSGAGAARRPGEGVVAGGVEEIAP